MIEQWICVFVGKMHQNRITQRELSKHMGVSTTWISDVLNCKRSSKDAEQKFNKALDELIEIKTK